MAGHSARERPAAGGDRRRWHAPARRRPGRRRSRGPGRYAATSSGRSSTSRALYDAWDIEENYASEGEEIGGVESIEVVETGPLRGAVRVRRRWRDSRIEQTYRLLAGSRRLDIVTDIDWHEREIYLQARFPLAVHSHEATFETMYGVVRRPTHRNTSWDAARFEVSAHRFADLSEPGYGVALLNDGKYGHSVHGNVLTLSLLRSPLYPDPTADEGEHHFTYSLLPHAGDWTEAASSTKRSP